MDENEKEQMNKNETEFKNITENMTDTEDRQRGSNLCITGVLK